MGTTNTSNQNLATNIDAKNVKQPSTNVEISTLKSLIADYKGTKNLAKLRTFANFKTFFTALNETFHFVKCVSNKTSNEYVQLLGDKGTQCAVSKSLTPLFLALYNREISQKDLPELEISQVIDANDKCALPYYLIMQKGATIENIDFNFDEF